MTRPRRRPPHLASCRTGLQRSRPEHLSGVEFLNGDSRQLLGPVLERLAEPAVLWLDARWRAEGTFGPTAGCPPLDELGCVNQARCDHVVLIDDARLFLAPSPAPHRYDQWPDLLHVASALAEGRFSRYAAVFEDVTPCLLRRGRIAWHRLAERWGARSPHHCPGHRGGSRSAPRARYLSDDRF